MPSTTHPKVTLKSLAAEAGVSPMVISAVARNDFSRIRVSEARRQQIQRLIAKRQYTPSATAQSLTYQRTQIISVLVPSLRFFAVPFQFKLLESLERCLAAADYRISLCPCGAPDTGEDERLLTRIQADAGLFFHYGTGSGAALARVGRLPFPILVFGHQEQDRHSTCYLDNRSAMAELTARVVATGHRRIAYVHAFGGDAYNRDGHAGVQQAAAASGAALTVLPLTIPRPRPVHHAELQTLGRQAAQALLALKPSQRPSAVIFSSDTIAACAMRILAEHGVRMPNDLLVVANGCDDMTDLIATPPMGKASPDAQASGAACARVLLDLIAHPDRPLTRQAIPLSLTGLDAIPELP